MFEGFSVEVAGRGRGDGRIVSLVTMEPLPTFRKAYHRLIPRSIRDPLGLRRRLVMDNVRRWISAAPLPTPDLLLKVQLTPFLKEYLTVGRAQAMSVKTTLHDFGVAAGDDVLDFGCGCGRTLWHLRENGWRLHGCDVDTALVAWCQEHLPTCQVVLSRHDPPLPFADNAFGAVFAASVFTHFAAPNQHAWADEMARVVRQGGLLIVSSMGPYALGNFPEIATPKNLTELRDQGFLFIPSASTTFNSQGAYHTREGIQAVFAKWFDPGKWVEGGLDGFQDLSVFRKKRGETASLDANQEPPKSRTW